MPPRCVVVSIPFSDAVLELVIRCLSLHHEIAVDPTSDPLTLFLHRFTPPHLLLPLALCADFLGLDRLSLVASTCLVSTWEASRDEEREDWARVIVDVPASVREHLLSAVSPEQFAWILVYMFRIAMMDSGSCAGLEVEEDSVEEDGNEERMSGDGAWCMRCRSLADVWSRDNVLSQTYDRLREEVCERQKQDAMYFLYELRSQATYSPDELDIHAFPYRRYEDGGCKLSPKTNYHKHLPVPPFVFSSLQVPEEVTVVYEEVLADAISSLCCEDEILQLSYDLIAFKWFRSSLICPNLIRTLYSSRVEHFRSLQEIDFSGCTNLDEEAMELLARCFPRVVKVCFCGCFSLSEGAFETYSSTLYQQAKELDENYPPLQKLNLRDCRNLGDDTLRFVSRYLCSVNDLCLYGNYDITDEGIAYLASSDALQLRKLNVCGAYRISDRIMVGLRSRKPIISYIDPEEFAEEISEAHMNAVAPEHLRSPSAYDLILGLKSSSRYR